MADTGNQLKKTFNEIARALRINHLTGHLDEYQKRTLWIMAVLGLAYFILLGIPNARNAADEHMLFVLSQDENIQYPYVMRMITPDDTLIETLSQFIAYQHYFYGYPFYLLSALVLLPVRLLFGGQQIAQTQLNLFLLRQFINVLPMTLALIVLVYLQTQFRSRWRSIVLFIFLASLPAVFRSNLNWWHPDNLAVLFVVLTMFFLSRDKLEFGRNFMAAAICTGLTIGTKVFGFFFFTVIGGYLLIGLLKHTLNIKKAVRAGLTFIFIMLITIIASNPMLLHTPSRQRIIQTQAKQNYEVTHGWDKPEEASEYEKGIQAWLPYLKKGYASAPILILAGLSLAAASIWGQQRTFNLIATAWIFTYGVYLFSAVAIKNDHYWLPVLIPFFSASLALTHPGRHPDWLVPLSNPKTAEQVSKAVALVILAGLAVQAAVNIAADAGLYHNAMIAEYLLKHNINP